MNPKFEQKTLKNEDKGKHKEKEKEKEKEKDMDYEYNEKSNNKCSYIASFMPW